MVKQIGGFVTLVAVLLLASCKQVEYIPIESVVKDTIYRESVKIDSVIMTDSVFLHIHTIGDTVYSEKVKVLYRDRYKYERDTIYLHRTDTIRVPVPIERKATLWEQTKENLGNLIRFAGLIVFGGFLLWFISLLRKQK
jgi:hypothetical protein